MSGESKGLCCGGYCSGQMCKAGRVEIFDRRRKENSINQDVSLIKRNLDWLKKKYTYYYLLYVINIIKRINNG